MTKLVLAGAAFSLFLFAAPADRHLLPVWAYGTDARLAALPKPAPIPQETVQHLPGSKFSFTEGQIQDRWGPADWFPQDHPAMPDIVAHGRKPEVWACSLCHYPNGKGRPENAGVAGLPVDYFVHQMHEFRDGHRVTSDPRKANTALMSAFARNMTEEQIEQAAKYFGAMPWTPWIKVVETSTVARMRTSVGMYLPLAGDAKEPLGDQIIETPVNPVATEDLRDPRSGFIAYVPVGSVGKGETLVTIGGGKTTPCAVCHGAGLKGLGPVPGIAGRSPSYITRQLYDMQKGNRRGDWEQLMAPVVAKLSTDDMLAIAAYTASLQP